MRFVLMALAAILFTGPAAAQACQTWETGVASAAAYVAASKDRVAGVLLTEAETAAVWVALFPKSDVPPPWRMGIFIVASKPGEAMLVGFKSDGCVTGSGKLAFGVVIDALETADVKSEFAAIEPAEPGADT